MFTSNLFHSRGPQYSHFHRSATLCIELKLSFALTLSWKLKLLVKVADNTGNAWRDKSVARHQPKFIGWLFNVNECIINPLSWQRAHKGLHVVTRLIVVWVGSAVEQQCIGGVWRECGCCLLPSALNTQKQSVVSTFQGIPFCKCRRGSPGRCQRFPE